ncbi:MAG TPA: hypothetical protein VIY27_06030 [Myxococcota bacterium]
MARRRKPRARRGRPQLQPFVSAGVPLLREDGSVEMPPMQLFVTASGSTILRIGNNTLWFDENGVFDGTEHRLTKRSSQAKLEQAMAVADELRGMAPPEPYFQPGSDGWESEVAGWPEEGEEPERGPGGAFYQVGDDDDDDGTPPVLHN